MPTEVSLIIDEQGGEPRRVVVRGPRFTVGRGADNDLCINDRSLSRRHAAIEFLGGRPYLSDCGSSNGTSVNGQPLAAAVELYDGDLITLGDACAFSVSISEPQPAQVEAAAPPEPAARTGEPPPAPESADAPASRAPLVAGVCIGLLLLGAVVLFVATRGDGRGGERKTRGAASGPFVPEELGPMKAGVSNGGGTANDGAANGGAANGGAAPHAGTGVGEDVGAGAGGPAAESDDLLAREIKRVMSRISTDNAPYISEAGLRDVAGQVRAYRGSASVAARLRAMGRGCAEVSALAQQNNLKPALLMYAALAQAESGDPVAAARQMTPKLLTLRATFGTETANSSLLLVAAYPYPFNPTIGSQERTPHPLASKLMQLGGRQSVVDTSVARSVWFLREKGGITPEAYGLVVRTLALGVVAQSPRQYGVEAEPLLC